MAGPPDAGPEGEILLELDWRPPAVAGVRIRSTRPLHGSRLFVGKRPHEALPLVPLLFAVCGTAQSYTAATACERALGIPTPPATDEARRLLVLFETAREHLWRVFMDWPRLRGAAAQPGPVAEASALMTAFRRALWGEEKPFLPGAMPSPDAPAAALEAVAGLERLLTGALDLKASGGVLEAADPDGLCDWARARPGPDILPWVRERGWGVLLDGAIEPLPALEPKALQPLFEGLDVDEFLARPRWDGATRETGPFARCRTHPLPAACEAAGEGLLARLAARLVELAAIPEQLFGGLERLAQGGEEPAEARSRDGGTGLAQAEAARGRLVHYVRVEGGLIADFRILAPTEWNFHPDGLLARALAAVRAHHREELEQAAGVVVTAVDPCVGCRVMVR